MGKNNVHGYICIHVHIITHVHARAHNQITSPINNLYRSVTHHWQRMYPNDSVHAGTHVCAKDSSSTTNSKPQPSAYSATPTCTYNTTCRSPSKRLNHGGTCLVALRTRGGSSHSYYVIISTTCSGSYQLEAVHQVQLRVMHSQLAFHLLLVARQPQLVVQ